jgi:hypothetical protein
MADFIPSADADFDRWFNNICQYINQKTKGTKPEWTHIPAAEIASINRNLENWNAAWAAYCKPHTEVETRAKNKARAAGEKDIRLFKHRNIDFRDEVNEMHLIAMGLNVRSDSSETAGTPDIRPEIIVENTRNRFEHKVKALNPQSRTFRKPPNARGTCFAARVGGERPATGADVGNTKFSQRSTMHYTYSEADKGKPVFYSVCYENAKGEKGPWSPVEEAIIG